MLTVGAPSFGVAEATRGWSYITALVICAATLVLMPPLGFWSDGEEHYLLLAKQFAGSADVPAGSALLGGMPHAVVFLAVAGWILNLLGDTLGQGVLRVLVAAMYGLALVRLFRVTGLRLPASLGVLSAFWLAGQCFFADEWLFRGVEPKTLSYSAVLLAVSYSIERRYWPAVLWMSAATVTHVLIGVVWTGLLALTLAFRERGIRSLLAPAAAYSALVAPFFAYLWFKGYFSPRAIDPTLPSAAWILSFVRMPHHASPLADAAHLYTWKRGAVELGVAVLLTSWIAVRERGAVGLLALLGAVGGTYVLLVFGASWFDHGGKLGALTPFRPNSLVLLFVIIACAALVQRAVDGSTRRVAIERVICAGCVVAAAASAYAFHAAAAQRAADRAATYAPLFEYVRAKTSATSTFLLDPRLESDLFTFERKTHRRLLVLGKFIPAASDEVQEWYRRVLRQRTAFASGCPDPRDRVEYMVVSAASRAQTPYCGRVVLETDRFSLVQVDVGVP